MARIDCYSHYFKITELDNRCRQIIQRFIRNNNTKYGTRAVGWAKGKPILERFPAQVFAVAMKDGLEFRLHINQYQDFMDFVKADNMTAEFRVINNPLFKPLKCDFKMNPKWEIRGGQGLLIDYIIGDTVNNKEARQRAAVLQAGSGKTFSSLYAVSKMATRTVLTIKGGYVEQWVKALEKTYDGLKKGDVLTISGGKNLISLMNLALSGELTAKFIIITNKTFQNYITDYIDNRHAYGIYPIPIDRFFETLGVGLLINDEVHMHFHFNFMQDLFSHVPRTVGLTATLTPDEVFMDNMYKIMFPMDTRFKGIPFNRYAKAVSLQYRLQNPRGVSYKQRGMGSYSHIVYEEWLFKNKLQLANYVKMIDTIVNWEYVSKRVPGEIMLIFGASIQFCTFLQKQLQLKYPELKIGRYVEDDPFENLSTHDICVSTLLSSGTAVDIPGLVRVLMTTAVGSSQLNEQAFGRLRDIPTKSELKFLWLTCKDIPQHVKYDEKKKELLKDKALSIDTYDINTKI